MGRVRLVMVAVLSLCIMRADDLVAGAGATFPAPLYQKWIAAFQQMNPGIEIKYDATGSADGVRRFTEGGLDFAASDILPDSEPNSRLLVLPSIVGAVVPVYNLPGLRQDLRFSAEVLAGIYMGQIHKWSDARLRALNRDAALPDKDIAVVHRSDGSGTTFVFSDFLSKTDAEWKNSLGAGSSLKWALGVGASGNKGVADKVSSTEFSIGYVEFIYAVQEHLSFGSVRNAYGKFVRADIDSIAAAAKTAQGSDDFRISITNAAGKDVYPLASFTWLLLSADASNASPKRDRLMSFLIWALGNGQRQAAALGYVPLPEDLAQRERQTLMANGAKK